MGKYLTKSQGGKFLFIHFRNTSDNNVRPYGTRLLFNRRIICTIIFSITKDAQFAGEAVRIKIRSLVIILRAGIPPGDNMS